MKKQTYKYTGMVFSFFLLASAPSALVHARSTDVMSKTVRISHNTPATKQHQATASTDENSQQKKSSITPEQQQKLKTFATEITQFVQLMNGSLQAFFDTNNRESYKKHVERFKGNINEFMNNVLIKLEQEKSRATQDTPYQQAVNTTHDIVDDLTRKMATIYGVLLKNLVKKDAKKLANELSAAQKAITKKSAVDAMIKNLNTLEKQLKSVNPKLAQRVTVLRKAISRIGSGKGPGQLALFSGIAHRLKCK